jgi:2-keto-4-pentenoate hydratase/2-oxohepta-3-ene-1,7-dioic acid hydratase in catechol pathway
MQLVLYDDYKPGALKGDAVVDLSGVAPQGRTGQETMEAIITGFAGLKDKFEAALASGKALPLSSVKLRAPLPRPGKVICMGVNYLEFTKKDPLPILVFFKSPEAILDPGGTVVLPPVDFRICHHEAEVVVVFGRQGRNVPESQWQNYVFGYTNGCDVSARGEFGGNSFIGKSFDTFCPIGPAITTKDAIADPHALHVRFWVDGQDRHDYGTDDMGHRIPECVAYVSSIMTINPGDILLLGTNHQGIGPLQDGESAVMETTGLGRLTFDVRDPLRRSWPKEIDTAMASSVKGRIEAGKY